MLTEIPERDVGRQFVGDQLARRGGDKHLPAVAGRADPRRPMHVQPDVVVLSDIRLAGVDTDPHAHVDALGPALRRQRALRAHGGGDRVAGTREGHEERITLGVDLATVVFRERRPQQPLMLRKHLAVPAAQPRQQPRRTLDVAEQERDRPARKLRHTCSYAEPPRPVKSSHATARDLRRLHRAAQRDRCSSATKPAVSGGGSTGGSLLPRTTRSSRAAPVVRIDSNRRPRRGARGRRSDAPLGGRRRRTPRLRDLRHAGLRRAGLRAELRRAVRPPRPNADPRPRGALR